MKIHCLSEALSPITHMAGTEGNEAIIAREQITLADGSIRWLPYLSGNAIRHNLVRRYGMRWLVAELGLSGKLSLEQLNFLFHGGSVTMSTQFEDTKRIAEMQRLFPLLSLLGGSLPDQIIAGRLRCWRGTLICEENRRYIAPQLPDGWELPTEQLRSSESFLTNWQYTRGDARSDPTLAKPEATEPTPSQLMIFNGQALAPGAAFFHGFQIDHTDASLDLGALLWSVQLWQEAGGTVGGNARIGHGKLKLHVMGDVDVQARIGQYHSHVAAHKQECADWLEAAFKKKEGKPKRGKRDVQDQPQTD